MNPSRASVLCAAYVVALGSATVRGELIPVGDFPPPDPLPKLVYLIETDKEVYQVGEEVRITHRALNQGEVSIRLEFLYSPGFEFEVLRDGEKVGPGPSALGPGAWLMGLAPGECYVTQWTWDMNDSDGSPVPPGRYDIVGIAHGGPSPIIVGGRYPGPPVTSITIVPEPGMLGFVSLGFGVLLRRKRD